MCLGVPGSVVEVWEKGGLKMGRVDFGGVTKEVCLAYTPDAEIGDYVVVHVGFAISKLDQEEAGKVFYFLNAMGELGELQIPEV